MVGIGWEYNELIVAVFFLFVGCVVCAVLVWWWWWWWLVVVMMMIYFGERRIGELGNERGEKMWVPPPKTRSRRRYVLPSALIGGGRLDYVRMDLSDGHL